MSYHKSYIFRSIFPIFGIFCSLSMSSSSVNGQSNTSDVQAFSPVPPFTHPSSPFIGHAISLLLSINLLQSFCVQMPLSLSNCFFQWQTSLIHPNLKCVLMAQSACFFAFALCQCVQIMLTFIFGLEHWLDYQPLQLVIMFCIGFMNAIGHILLLERLLATFLWRKYDKLRGRYFSICWLTIVCSYCAYTAYVQVLVSEKQQAPGTTMEISPIIIFSAYLFAGLALLESIVIILIGGHNLKEYKRQLRIQGHHDLGERFQIKDNIRTARQLTPTFILHFLNILISCQFPLVLSYGLITDFYAIQMYSILVQIVMACGNSLIEYTIISRHPILRQNACKLLANVKRIFFPSNSRRIGGSANRIDTNSIRNSSIHEQQEIESKRSRQMTEDYFRILNEEWK